MEERLGDDQVLALSARQPDAFTVFYERHAEELLRFFARRTLDPDAAAELTAETFAQAFASRKRFRPKGGGAVAWLYGIARHQLGHFFRGGAVAVRARGRLGMPVRSPSDEDYERIEELFDLAGARRAVANGFDRLSTDQRDALRMRIVEERPYPEVAVLLDCSEQAARARVSRGLKRLTEVLETEHPELELGGKRG